MIIPEGQSLTERAQAEFDRAIDEQNRADGDAWYPVLELMEQADKRRRRATQLHFVKILAIVLTCVALTVGAALYFGAVQ